MSDLVKLLKSHFRNLQTSFEMTFSVEQVPHSGERGRLLEGELKDLLTLLLPNRVGVGSGQIAAGFHQNMSKQIDLALYDTLNYPLLLNKSSYQIFPNEAVLAVIEVKSRLNKSSPIEGVENINSVKVLPKYPSKKHPQTLGILFCYKTDWTSIPAFLGNLNECAENAQLPDLICSLNPGFILVFMDTLGKYVRRLSHPADEVGKGSELSADEQGKFALIQPGGEFSREHILLWFYLILIDYLNFTLCIGVNMGQYVNSPTYWWEDLKDLSEFIQSPRDTFKYYFRVGDEVTCIGVTKDLKQTEKKHQENWPKGSIDKVGRRTTEKSAKKWVKKEGYNLEGQDFVILTLSHNSPEPTTL